MLKSNSDRVRVDPRSVDRLTPRSIGLEVLLPLLTVALAACAIAFGASAFVHLLAPAIEALK